MDAWPCGRREYATVEVAKYFKNRIQVHNSDRRYRVKTVEQLNNLKVFIYLIIISSRSPGQPIGNSVDLGSRDPHRDRNILDSHN